MDTTRDTVRTDLPEGMIEEKARDLLQHGSTRDIRKFLESIPGTPENKAAAKREHMERIQRQRARKRKEQSRRKNRQARQSRAKNRGRS